MRHATANRPRRGKTVVQKISQPAGRDHDGATSLGSGSARVWRENPAAPAPGEFGAPQPPTYAPPPQAQAPAPQPPTYQPPTYQQPPQQ